MRVFINSCVIIVMLCIIKKDGLGAPTLFKGCSSDVLAEGADSYK